MKAWILLQQENPTRILSGAEEIRNHKMDYVRQARTVRRRLAMISRRLGHLRARLPQIQIDELEAVQAREVALEVARFLGPVEGSFLAPIEISDDEGGEPALVLSDSEYDSDASGDWERSNWAPVVVWNNGEGDFAKAA